MLLDGWLLFHAQQVAYITDYKSNTIKGSSTQPQSGKGDNPPQQNHFNLQVTFLPFFLPVFLTPFSWLVYFPTRIQSTFLNLRRQGRPRLAHNFPNWYLRSLFAPQMYRKTLLRDARGTIFSGVSTHRPALGTAPTKIHPCRLFQRHTISQSHEHTCEVWPHFSIILYFHCIWNS